MSQHTNDAGVIASLRKVVDTASARTVFGDPISHGGVVVLPAAKMGGGAGGGSAPAEDGQEPAGTGGGFGVTAKPLGVFVIREDGRVQWQPAIDVNKVILGGQIVVVAALLALRAVIKARARRRDA